MVDNGRLVLANLRALMGAQAPILVATVDDPSDSSGDAGRLGLPPWPAALELLVELNRALRTLGEDYRALWPMCMPASSATASPPATPGRRPPARDLWYCQLIEPNACAAGEIRAAFWAALERMAAKQP